MRPTITKGLLFLTLGVSLFSCTKEEPTSSTTFYTLPPLSNSGANTAGDFNNSEVYILNDAVKSVAEIRKDVNMPGRSNLHLSFGLKSKNYKEEHSFTILKFIGTGYYEIPKECHINYSRQNLDPGSSPVINESTASDITEIQGFINILTFDTLQRIISGTYEYQFQDSSVNKGSTVKIADGRFDLKY